MRALISVCVAAIVALTAQLAGVPIPARSPVPDPRSPVSRVAPRAPRLASRSTRVFSAWDKTDSPGCAVGVFRDGATRVSAAATAWRRSSTICRLPPTPVFYAGSVSKQFTAMAVALAIQQGKLVVRRFDPEVPAGAAGLRRRDQDQPPPAPHQRAPRLQHALVDRRPARRRRLGQPRGAADDGAAVAVELRARRRVPLLEHRLHAARDHRRARDRHAVRRLCRRQHLQAARDGGHPLPRRCDAGWCTIARWPTAGAAAAGRSTRRSTSAPAPAASTRTSPTS